jgi:hypothetical protein
VNLSTSKRYSTVGLSEKLRSNSASRTTHSTSLMRLSTPSTSPLPHCLVCLKDDAVYIADALLLKCCVAGIGHPGACRPVIAQAAAALHLKDKADWEVLGAEARTAQARNLESQEATTRIGWLTDGPDDFVDVVTEFRKRRGRRRRRIEQVEDGVSSCGGLQSMPSSCTSCRRNPSRTSRR